MPTIRDLDEADHLLRIWCLTCARGTEIDPDIWRKFARKGWPIDLVEARSKFRCKACRSADNVLLLPATPPPITGDIWKRMVEGFFHSNRHARKRGR